MNTRQAAWLIIGFLTAPLATALTSVLLANDYGSGGGDLSDFFLALTVIYLFSFMPIVLVGVASIAIAHRLGLVRWWIALFVGLVGGVSFRLIGHFNQLDLIFNKYGLELINYALSGAAAALWVWWCWYSGYVREARRQSA